MSTRACKSACTSACKSLLVLLQGGGNNAAVLQVTAELALHWRAHVLGLGLAQVVPTSAGMGDLDGTLLQTLLEELRLEMRACENEFRSRLGGRAAGLAWQHSPGLEPLVQQAAKAARAADLVVTCRSHDGMLDLSRHMDAGDLVLAAGRPVLVVPVAPGVLAAMPQRHAMVAWQDSRESRRAVADALPLLQMSTRVTLAQVAHAQSAGEARAALDDVAAWLLRHGVHAETVVSVSSGIDGEALYTLAQDGGVDLMVAGAYGHGRLREWVFGGVTRDTLLHAGCCVLLSN